MTDESTVGCMGFVKDREDKHGADVSSFFPFPCTLTYILFSSTCLQSANKAVAASLHNGLENKYP